MIRELTIAIRPRTLPAGAVPVVVGTLLAVEHGHQFNLPLFALTLLFSLAVQSTTNLANDYFDFVKGADTASRLGPTRVMQAGIVSAGWMRLAIALFLLLSAALGSALVVVGGLPLAIILILSLLLAVGYTGGPFPLAYLGLGEAFVFLFFGIIATTATYYLATGEWSLKAVLFGASLGCISSAMLVANNLRDMESDRKANKRTLAVRFGKLFSRIEFCVFLVLSPLCVLPYFLSSTLASGVVLGWYLLVIFPTVIRFLQREGRELNRSLADTGKLLLLYGTLLSVVLALKL